jgi:hypothetical protein
MLSKGRLHLKFHTHTLHLSYEEGVLPLIEKLVLKLGKYPRLILTHDTSDELLKITLKPLSDTDDPDKDVATFLMHPSLVYMDRYLTSRCGMEYRWKKLHGGDNGIEYEVTG